MEKFAIMDYLHLKAEFTNLRGKLIKSASQNRIEELRTFVTISTRIIDDAVINNIILEKEKECMRNELAYWIFESLINK